MKTLMSSLLLVLFLSITTSCLTPKTITVQQATGEVKLKTPFSEAKYRTDKDMYRATGVEFMEDQQSAKDAAYMSASSLISLQIKQQLYTFNHRFAQALTASQSKEYESKFNFFIDQKANEIIGEANFVDDETFVDKSTGVMMYRVYCLVEKSKESVRNQYQKLLSTDDKLKLLFDEKKFREEMAKDNEMLKKDFNEKN